MLDAGSAGPPLLPEPGEPVPKVGNPSNLSRRGPNLRPAYLGEGSRDQTGGRSDRAIPTHQEVVRMPANARCLTPASRPEHLDGSFHL